MSALRQRNVDMSTLRHCRGEGGAMSSEAGGGVGDIATLQPTGLPKSRRTTNAKASVWPESKRATNRKATDWPELPACTFNPKNETMDQLETADGP